MSQCASLSILYEIIFAEYLIVLDGGDAEATEYGSEREKNVPSLKITFHAEGQTLDTLEFRSKFKIQIQKRVSSRPAFNPEDFECDLIDSSMLKRRFSFS